MTVGVQTSDFSFLHSRWTVSFTRSPFPNIPTRMATTTASSFCVRFMWRTSHIHTDSSLASYFYYTINFSRFFGGTAARIRTRSPWPRKPFSSTVFITRAGSYCFRLRFIVTIVFGAEWSSGLIPSSASFRALGPFCKKPMRRGT